MTRLETRCLDGLFFEIGAVALASPIDETAEAELTEGERALVAQAVAKRRREFATGRKLAHAVLRELGVAAPEVLNGPDRAPIWPEGFSGSISHCDRCAVVAVMRAERGTVGVDVEHRAELARELWKTVFLPSEIEMLESRFDVSRRSRMALVLFSAKEAAYKAQYPRTGAFMGFHELRVDVGLCATDGSRGMLVCTFQNDVRSSPGWRPNAAWERTSFLAGTEVQGRFHLDAVEGARVLTGVFIE